MVKTKIYFLLVVLFYSPLSSSSIAHSAQPIDCINVKSADIQNDSYVNYEYVLQINSLCQLNTISDIDRLWGTGITLDIRGPNTIKKTSSVGNLTSTQKISFSLGNLKDGDYTVTLQFSKPGQTSRSLSLPSFTLSNVLECIDLTRSFTEEVSNKSILKIYLRNTCISYSDSDFANLAIKMELITDFYPLVESKSLSIDRLSSSESLFIFDLDSLPPGIYLTSTIKVFTRTKSREIPLDFFAISKKVTSTTNPTPTATKSSTSKNPLEDIQQCSTSKGFDESCTYAPDWYFEFCAVHLEGALEQKIGSTWKSVKKVKASRTDKSCGKNFNLFEVEGVSNSATKKLTFRVQLYATSKYKQSSILFYITPKYKP